MSRQVGTVSKTPEEIRVEWNIEKFSSLSEIDTDFESPAFEFLGETWFLRIRSDEYSYGSNGYIGVYLHKKNAFYSSVSVVCSFGLKTADGRQFGERDFVYTFQKSGGRGFDRYMKISEMYKRKQPLTPLGALTIVCSLRKYKPSLVSRTKELSQDFKSLMSDDTDSDVTVRIQEQELRLHRSVLGIRSPVLAAMFKHEMSEKKTGVLSIEDCGFRIFRLFVHYLYTGKVELTTEKVFDLFKVADKYQVKELADDCVQYIISTLTVDTFCDAVELAINHGYQDLMDEAVDLLSDRMSEIVRTEKWRRFLLNSPDEANKVLTKVFDEMATKN